MTLGPLEYTVIGFRDNQEFRGAIAEELARVVEQGTIRIVDLVFVAKSTDGEVAFIEADGRDEQAFEGFRSLLQGTYGLLTPEDLGLLAEEIPTDSSALIVLFEHRWAVHLKDAILDAGGFLVSRETISPEALIALNEELEAAGVTA